MPNDSDNFSHDSVAKSNVLTAASLQLWTPTNKEKLTYWFDVSDNVRSSNELYTEYAYQILEKNFAASGLDLKRGFHEKNLNWSSFCWYFYRHVCDLVETNEHRELMREIFAELADFCSLTGGNLSGRYAVLLHDFLVDFNLPTNIAALLPGKIHEKMPEIEKSFRQWMKAEVEREQEMIRQGMMGY